MASGRMFVRMFQNSGVLVLECIGLVLLDIVVLLLVIQKNIHIYILVHFISKI